MPLSRYDRYYGGKGGAAKALAAMIARYGEKQGRAYFYGHVNNLKKRKK